MNNRIPISVMLIAFNAESFIEKAIQGILDQTFSAFELIIVNDGSTDRTKQIVEKLQANDNRIKYYENDGNKGLIYTRNRALKLCDGKYIAINDADDYSYPNRFKTQIEFMERNSDVVCCGTNARIVYSNSTKTEDWIFPENHDQIMVEMFEHVAHLNSTVFIRNDSLKKNKIEHRKEYPTAEDYKLYFDLSKFGKLHNIQEQLLDYLRHPQQESTANKTELTKNAFKVVLEKYKSFNVKMDTNLNQILFKVFAYDKSYTLQELKKLITFYVKILETNYTKNSYNLILLKKMFSKKVLMVASQITKKEGFSVFSLLIKQRKYFKISYFHMFKIGIKSIIKN